MGEWGGGPASIALPLCQWPCRSCDDCQDVVGSVGKTFQMRLSRWPHRADPGMGSGLRGFGARGMQPSAGCGGASPPVRSVGASAAQTVAGRLALAAGTTAVSGA